MLRTRQSMSLFVPRSNPADDLAERDAGHGDHRSNVTGQMVERTDDFSDGLVRDVGVDLRGGDARMPEQDLHDANAGPLLEQVRGECMAETSRRDTLSELGRYGSSLAPS